LLRPCFARTGPWLQAGTYAAAVMSQIPERNGWTIATQIGDQPPDKTQRLLSRAVRDTSAAMAVVRRFAVAGLDEAARRTGRRRGLAVGAIDGNRPAQGRKPHRRGEAAVPGLRGQGGQRNQHRAPGICTGRHRARAYRRPGMDPAGHLKDPAKSAVMGLPADLAFRTKGQLAIDILAGAFAGGVRLDFVSGDEVHGSCTELREFCEACGQACVLRVPSSFRLPLAGGITLTCKQAAARLGSRRGGEVRPAGTGSKGQRWYAWAWPRSSRITRIGELVNRVDVS